MPAFVSTLAICIVFVPMFMLAGIARYLFVPLAEAVVFAMLASYVLSRTLVPTLAKYWLQEHDPHAHEKATGPLQRLQQASSAVCPRARALSQPARARAARRSALRRPVLGRDGTDRAAGVPGGTLPSGLGQDFFPSVDAGQIKLHLRAFTGTRIDETATLCDRVEATIREVIPARELATVVDNIGVPYSGINTRLLELGTDRPR